MQTDETTRRLYSILIQLAKRQDELAATEAAATRYWAPCPPDRPRTPHGGHAAACRSRRLATASRRS
jgi:hypothetical protein